ncbi:helix-turn-helix domain-containing protein [Cohnella yongneupensis]|uniref:Helix-turn-helix domain-containing protein n=1 Tax=Cohnella yongneupensis TaxID=425006 RepID=A0ABW0R434_9BACL
MNPWHEKIALKTNQPLKIIVSDEENGFPTHWHQEIEIVYVLGGNMQIGINKEIYSLHPGDLLFISSCELHYYYPNPLGCHKIILQLGKSVFDEYADHVFGHKFAHPLLRARDKTGELGDVSRKLEQTIQAILGEWEAGTVGHELAIKARMNDLAATIVRDLPLEAVPLQERTKRLEQLDRLDKVLKHIEREYASDIPLQRAADIAGFSPTYFSRFFKEATGSSFVDYVNTFRANIAMQLLAGDEHSVTEIAYQAGFNSIETFNRVFKRVNGEPPTRFRSKHSK